MSKIENPPTVWLLTDLYHEPRDPRLIRDRKWCLSEAEEFTKVYKHHVHQLTGDEFSHALAHLEHIEATVQKLMTYAYLSHMTHVSDTALTKLYQSTQNLESEITQKLYFFYWEWSQIPSARCNQILSDPKMNRYSYFFYKIRKHKKHLLPEEEMHGMHDFILTTQKSSQTRYDQLINSIKRDDGQPIISTLPHDLRSQDREKRKNAYRAVSSGLSEIAPQMTGLINTLVKGKALVDARYRFSNWLEQSNLENEIESSTLRQILESLAQYRHIVTSYYTFKKETLGYKDLYAHDLLSPIAPSPCFSWPEACRLLVSALECFSPQLSRTAAHIIHQHRIHALPQTDKAPGAFAHPGGSGYGPFLFLNFKGSRRDLALLAHEMGHALHYYCGRNRCPLSSKPPLPSQEIVAILSELLLIHYLDQHAATPMEKLLILNGFVEDCIHTIFRQASLHRFESDLHQQIGENGDLSTAQISRGWRRTQTELYANQVIFTASSQHDWALIPHFFHTPGYVRIYTVAGLTSLALLHKWEQGDLRLPSRLIDFMGLGHSCHLRDMLSVLGIGPTEWGTVCRQGLTYLETKLLEMLDLARRYNGSKTGGDDISLKNA